MSDIVHVEFSVTGVFSPVCLSGRNLNANITGELFCHGLPCQAERCEATYMAGPGRTEHT